MGVISASALRHSWAGGTEASKFTCAGRRGLTVRPEVDLGIAICRSFLIERF